MPEEMKQGVALVIPGRNSAGTIGRLLTSVVPMLEQGRLEEIIFVDDGSTDDSVAIAEQYPVRVVRGPGRGPGAARNLGWRQAKQPLVWFLDSDTDAQPDALEKLLTHVDDPEVGGVGGSLLNSCPDSLLACLVHEEIMERHGRMGPRVNFLATANVLYRRRVIEEVGGFDERFLKGQDAEFSFRVLERGYALGFEQGSRVGHAYIRSWPRYMKSQAQQGYWRVLLHLSHRGHAGGDSYSSLLDHLQPPLALVAVVSLPLLVFAATWWIPVVLMGLLLLAQVPLTGRIVRRTKQAKYVMFAPFGVIRAVYRAVGMTRGVIDLVLGRIRGRDAQGVAAAQTVGKS